eukprot:3505436-Rhodomonas_salina.1
MVPVQCSTWTGRPCSCTPMVVRSGANAARSAPTPVELPRRGADGLRGDSQHALARPARGVLVA